MPDQPIPRIIETRPREEAMCEFCGTKLILPAYHVENLKRAGLKPSCTPPYGCSMTRPTQTQPEKEKEETR